MNSKLSSIVGELHLFKGGRYPGFITSCSPQPLLKDTVAVFMFHTVEPYIFENQLRFLKENEYDVLSSDGYTEFIQGRKQLSAPGVLLTFDDGERSLYHTAYPLLKKFGFKAVAFLVPSRILDARKNISNRKKYRKEWLTWGEVREMQDAGVVDMQSHTMHHERIFTGPELQGFIRPGLLEDDLKLDMPTIMDAQGSVRQIQKLGTPVYSYGSRMDDKPRFLDSPAVRLACTEHVANNGNEQFFKHSGWLRELSRVWKEAAACVGDRYESVLMQRNAIFSSLKESRDLLEERLQKPARHLAFPWCSAGKLARELSREAGYVTNFLGPLPGIPITRPGMDPYMIPRLKDDYLIRLPGKGRHALSRVFMHKMIRRLTKDDIY